jgi:hypothetical protein
MIKFIEMDEMVTLSDQMEENAGPVILINKFNVKSEDADQLIKAWAAEAAYFKQQSDIKITSNTIAVAVIPIPVPASRAILVIVSI